MVLLGIGSVGYSKGSFVDMSLKSVVVGNINLEALSTASGVGIDGIERLKCASKGRHRRSRPLPVLLKWF